MAWRAETSSRSHCSIKHCKLMSNDANRCRLMHSECSAFAARHCWQFSQLHWHSEVASKSSEGSIPAANRCQLMSGEVTSCQTPPKVAGSMPAALRKSPYSRDEGFTTRCFLGNFGRSVTSGLTKRIECLTAARSELALSAQS